MRALEDADVVRVQQIMECEANKAGLGDEVMTKEYLHTVSTTISTVQCVCGKLSRNKYLI